MYFVPYFTQNGRYLKRFCKVSCQKCSAVVWYKKINNFVLSKQYMITLLIAKKIYQWKSVTQDCRASLPLLRYMMNVEHARYKNKNLRKCSTEEPFFEFSSMVLSCSTLNTLE